MATTINIDPATRDRLRAYCAGGTSYSEAIERLMALVEADRFFSSFRSAMDDPDFPWLEELDWD